MKITDEYKAMNAELHESNAKYGTSGKIWASRVGKLAAELKATSILDYGCGKQTLSGALPGMMITGYDPCIEGLDEPPISHDLVVCGDVLEHIEPECIEDVLDDLKRLAIKAVFLVVALTPAQKTLSDGRNAHILQRPVSWWLPKIMERWELQMFQGVTMNDKMVEFIVVAK